LRRSKYQTQILFKEGNIYGEQEHSTNILQNPLWQPRERFSNPNMACDRHENTYQKSLRIYQNIQCFSNNPLFRTVRINRVDYLYNSSDNIIEIDGILYNIQWEGKYPIIVNNNRSRMNTLSLIGKSAKLAITSYLACLVREEGVEQIHFLLAQHATESCPISKSLGYIIRLLADI